MAVYKVNLDVHVTLSRTMAGVRGGEVGIHLATSRDITYTI